MELLQAADTGQHHVTHPGLVGTGDVDHKVVGFGNGLTLKICILFTIHQFINFFTSKVDNMLGG